MSSLLERKHFHEVSEHQIHEFKNFFLPKISNDLDEDCSTWPSCVDTEEVERACSIQNRSVFQRTDTKRHIFYSDYMLK